MSRRVVITGIGLVTPIGLNAQTSWDSLINAHSGIRTLTRFDPNNQRVKIAGEVKNFNILDYVDAKESRKMDTFIQYAIAAGDEAIKNSNLKITDASAHRVGCITGTGLGGLPEIENSKIRLMEKGKVSPFFIPMVIGNLAPGHLAIRHKLKGPNLSIATACASGLHAVGEAFRYIREGICDAMISGGAESAMSPLTFNGFASMRALSTRNESPETASRPFDKDRDGFIISEGAGILVLEELEHAKSRKASIYAEIAGYGASCDANHITTPAVDGPTQAMKLALENAAMNPSDFQYVNAHGTSTYYNDINETMAIKKVFGEHSKKLMVSSNKSMIGHCLGAAGGIETAFTALTINKSIIPPTINFNEADPGCDLDYVPHTSREIKVNAAICNSFGFGGTNASIALKKFI